MAKRFLLFLQLPYCLDLILEPFVIGRNLLLHLIKVFLVAVMLELMKVPVIIEIVVLEFVVADVGSEDSRYNNRIDLLYSKGIGCMHPAKHFLVRDLSSQIQLYISLDRIGVFLNHLVAERVVNLLTHQPS